MVASMMVMSRSWTRGFVPLTTRSPCSAPSEQATGGWGGGAAARKAQQHAEPQLHHTQAGGAAVIERLTAPR